ncbi:MAG: HAMP domain-containing protein, partial [Rhodospirillales bacterium]|nr:HAMP domain-containing protein [Rhodospirillales bacterium]
MPILARLLLAFASILALAALQGAVAVWKLSDLSAAVETGMERPVVGVDAARSAWDAFRNAQAHLENVTAAIRVPEGAAALAEFATRIDKVKGELARVRATDPDAATAQVLGEAGDLLARWERDARTLLGERPATSIASPHRMAQLETQVRAALDRTVAAAVAAAERQRAEIRADIAFARTLSVGFLLFAMVAGAVLAALSAASLTRPLVRLGNDMRLLSSGNLDIRIVDRDRRDEIGAMAKALEVFRDNAEAVGRLESDRRQNAG